MPSLTFCSTDDAQLALARLAAAGCGHAPILDRHRRPVGVVTLSAFRGGRVAGHVSDRMEPPGLLATPRTSLRFVAEALLEREAAGALVVDDDGGLVGHLCALDVARAALGLPPDPAPTRTREHAWSAPTPLDPQSAAAAATGPGIVALLAGPRIEWAHSAANMRRELGALAVRRPGRSYICHVRGHEAAAPTMQLFRDVVRRAAPEEWRRQAR